MTGTTTNGSVIIGSLSSTPAGLVGQAISGTGIQAGSTVTFIIDNATIAISLAALASGSGVTLTFSSPKTDLQAIGTVVAGSSGLLTSGTFPAPYPQIRGGVIYSTIGFLSATYDVIGSGRVNYSVLPAFLTTPNQGLSVKDVIDDMLLLWGIQQPTLAFPWMLKRAIHDLNAAYQMVWSVAKELDYFSRETITVDFGVGISQVTLPQTILTVLGPARSGSTGQPLRPLSSRAQFDAFGPNFLGAANFAALTGPPVAYWIERLNDVSSDDITTIMHVTPTPTVDTPLLLDVTIQAPRYLWHDYVNATPVQFPNRYADSVLLPFARYKAMSSQYFVQRDRAPIIVADWQNAKQIIGAVDPQQKEVQFSERASLREAS